MQAQDVILPELRPKPHHPPVPRRYEETRPATEKAIWSQANAIKEEALEATRKRLQAEHNRTVKKINRAHEKTLQDELTHLRALLEQAKEDAVNQMKLECDRKQQEALLQVEQLWQRKLIQLVEAAHLEEQKIAAENTTRVARQHEQEIDELESKLNQEKEQTLTELQQKCDAVKELAIKKAKTEEHNLAEGRMNHFKDLFEKQVRILHNKIGSLQHDIGELNQEKNKIIQQRIAVQQELVETRKEFQRFINTVYPFNKTDSRYVIPMIRSFSEQNWLDDSC
ncbi:hypothetical protein LSH36_74g00027 [Paralvinella palmiformis]|uniref:Uncharacterized protein n=1 Tax=Paralvinella palmiformis TaxID=53620 RepID=A0AAD9K456_9ANNE|nr:hypothetical protein LSH36_74g00027 [Paralvinella palmiformis]